MADIFDTLHPQKTPSDNLYPNIKPSQNIPDRSINKSKLGFTLDNDRGYAVIPDNEYIDIAYNGVPGNVYFPAGTRMAYLQDEGLVFSEPMRGHILMGGAGDEKPLIIIWYSITDNTVYASNVDTMDEATVFISADDFLVMILKRKLVADELNPRVFPLYSILPYDIIKYNTRDYYWVDLQNNFALRDMEYETLGAGYLCNRVYVQPTTQNWYRIAQINSFVLYDSVYGVISASTYIPISFMQSDKPVSALLFVSLNVRNGTDVSGCKATMIAGNADINNLRYTVDVDPDQSTCKVTVYVKGVAHGFISATELAYTRWDDDEEGAGHSTGEPFFYDEDTGSTAPPASSVIPETTQVVGNFVRYDESQSLTTKQQQQAKANIDAAGTEGTYPNLGAGKDADGNVIPETYAKQTGSYPNLGAGKDAEGNVISETYATKSEVTGGGITLPSTKTATGRYWQEKTWNGLTNFVSPFLGRNVWTDGESIYYSSSGDDYVLDKGASTWTAKTWNGLTNFDGQNVWTDGESIYYSSGSNHYVLDKSTSTWKAKTWGGLTVVLGQNIWTDGESIYYSSDSNHYVLGKGTSTWKAKTWNGLTNFYGQNVWTDGESVYYSSGSNHYVLGKGMSTWTAKTWNGLTNFYGQNVWTDGESVYCQNNVLKSYVLDKSTSTWKAKTWSGLSNFGGGDVWTDGENVYYSNTSSHYILFNPIETRPQLGEKYGAVKTGESGGGGDTAYHHHIQATINLGGDVTSSNSVQVVFTIINTDASPITTLEDLYNSIYALPWTTRETRWTPCTGGVWLRDTSNNWGAWPIIAIRSRLGAENEQQLLVWCYRVGMAADEGPFNQYSIDISTAQSTILDTVTDQYSNYVAGGEV